MHESGKPPLPSSTIIHDSKVLMGRSKHIKHCSWHIIACELKCRAKSGRGPQGFWADADTKETINWKPMYSNPIPQKNSKITNS